MPAISGADALGPARSDQLRRPHIAAASESLAAQSATAVLKQSTHCLPGADLPQSRGAQRGPTQILLSPVWVKGGRCLTGAANGYFECAP